MAMVGYPDQRKGREKGRHCKPGMSRANPAVPADTSIRNATGRIVLRLCSYQQGYSRFTNVSIILWLYKAAVAFLLYAIFSSTVSETYFVVSLLNCLQFKMPIRWFNVIVLKVKSQICEKAVKNSPRKTTGEACAVAVFREWMDKWRNSRTREQGGGERIETLSRINRSHDHPPPQGTLITQC